jgi:hypothetical protein
VIERCSSRYNESAGKHASGKTRKGSKWLGLALVEAANASSNHRSGRNKTVAVVLIAELWSLAFGAAYWAGGGVLDPIIASAARAAEAAHAEPVRPTPSPSPADQPVLSRWRPRTIEESNHNATVERKRLLHQLQHLRRAVSYQGPPRARKQLEKGPHPIRLLRELRPARLLTAGRRAP